MIHSSLESAAKEVPLAIEWRAFELRPQESRSPDDEREMAEKKKQIDAFWPRVEKIAKEVYGLTRITRGLWGIDTRLAHVGAKVAREAGVEDGYHLRVFEAHWVDQKDISQPGVLAEIAADLGVDRESFARSLETEELTAKVLAEEMEAHRLGINGVPAVIIDRRYLISGAQPKETLVRVFRQYAERGRLD